LKNAKQHNNKINQQQHFCGKIIFLQKYHLQIGLNCAYHTVKIVHNSTYYTSTANIYAQFVENRLCNVKKHTNKFRNTEFCWIRADI